MTSTFTTTADEVLAPVDLSGRQVVITGATGGLGRAAAISFARAGADTVLVGRDTSRLADAAAEVGAAGPGSTRMEQADLSDLESVMALVGRLDDLDRIDVLVLNAGVMAAPLERNKQGYEMQLAVSFLGHAALTNGLIETLKRSRARVVTLSSSGHWISAYDSDDPNFDERDYDKWSAYGQAKTATALMAIALADKFGGDGVVAAAVHPGVIVTDLQRHLSDEEEAQVIAMSAEQGEVRSVESGAASIVWAAVAPEVAESNGCYVANASVANELRAPHASSNVVAAQLWDDTIDTLNSDASLLD